MNYDELVTQLSIYAQQVPPNAAADFLTQLPWMIQFGELRILRDLADTLDARGQNTTLSATINSPLISLVGLPSQLTSPIVFQGDLLAFANPLTVERLEFQVSSAWIPLQRVSLDFVNAVWPNPSTTGVPTYGMAWYAMLDDVSAIVAPTPGLAYPVRLTGTWRPKALWQDNLNSYVSDVLPDLLVASCMIEVTGYMANFGAQSDDPKMAVSWLQMYQQKLSAARDEERRRRGLMPAPAPAAAGS